MNQKQLRKIKENKLIRTLALPAARIEANMRVARFQKSEDSLYLKKLKGCHRGEGCFVIGNGPSLSAADLDKLKENGFVCFGTNRIYQIYPSTKWRPTYYVCIDTYVVAAEIDKIKASGNYPKFINYKCANYGRRPRDNIHYLCTSSKIISNPYKMVSDTLSDDLSRYGTKTATVTVNAIELAIHMGFETIYLLGVDNNYAVQRMKDGTMQRNSSIKSSYFQGATASANLGDPVQVVDYTNESYEVCKKFAEKQGVKIFNATRGGKLEVFERVDFDELMRQKETEETI